MRLSYSRAMDIPRPDLSPRAASPVPPARPRFHPPEGLILAVPAGLAMALAVAVLLLGQGTGALVAGGLYLAAAAVVVVAMGRHYPHARLGACNVVTLMRLALTAALVAPLAGGAATGIAPGAGAGIVPGIAAAFAPAFAPGFAAGFAAGWMVAAIAAVALALDGVDGFLARRSNLCSEVGARFDMEVDAALALILALHAWQGSAVGAEVLVLGVMRYLFVGAGLILPWLLAPLPVSYRRKTVCVLQLAALIVLQLPQLPPDAAIVLARLAAAALIWSFARDVLWLRRHR